jgi:hypothetical protein
VGRERGNHEIAGVRLADRVESWLGAEPTPIPGARALRTTLRTAHVVAFAALYGGHLHDVAGERLVPALVATILTGGVLMGFEIYRARVWLVQARGLATFVKLIGVASVAAFWEWRVAILTGVIVIGVVTSHMPGRYRYYSLLHGRVVGHKESG